MSKYHAMKQFKLTLREDILLRIRKAAAAKKKSANSYAVEILDANRAIGKTPIYEEDMPFA